ncbi:hypothetical protein DDB_G0273025 [Dictyostelium discoideum AX4]|uniref:Uncharacterized protein n=1 Tax=Dictyostelium discoideum TaxID=44689 RepID=Q556F7_DICDI|nr:hypothetical protein DDB_G0274097 [Dictyostelium discoideum AX4]XP_645006.1 hypothetical protein DDB_G0273025 [Dictyostelium discoideum AX4]EAL70482.1 hypothetical protein DDB_G0274097 [Dictyostelium discoideum AX4]EAL71150.1 hypothetical protein DDB_G0273025 [Dictyostelium discoideum AX4]|eukprot:XP_644407.1 hypothetical protein DDB_G0274097 [Dictyostelium discoideum AX4]
MTILGLISSISNVKSISKSNNLSSLSNSLSSLQSMNSIERRGGISISNPGFLGGIGRNPGGILVETYGSLEGVPF